MNAPTRPLSVRQALGLLSFGEIERGECPAPALVDHALRFLGDRFPHAGDQEALREAILFGWRARHELQIIREEKA